MRGSTREGRRTHGRRAEVVCGSDGHGSHVSDVGGIRHVAHWTREGSDATLPQTLLHTIRKGRVLGTPSNRSAEVELYSLDLLHHILTTCQPEPGEARPTQVHIVSFDPLAAQRFCTVAVNAFGYILHDLQIHDNQLAAYFEEIKKLIREGK